MAQHHNEYVLGRGKVYLALETSFDAFDTVGERYTGNSPGHVLNIESQSLDHFNSDGGINELDASVVTQVNRSGTLTLDSIDTDNLTMFFLGTKAVISQVATPVVGEVIENVLPGLYFQLGASLSNPQGVRGVSAVTITNGGSPATTYVAGEDYELDAEAGRIYVVPGGDIPAGGDLTIGYTPVASTRDRVISGSKPQRGRLRYIEDNPAGTNRTFLMPLVELSPNGDFDLKGDAWRQIPFNLKVLKRGSLAALYIDGVPQV